MRRFARFLSGTALTLALALAPSPALAGAAAAEPAAGDPATRLTERWRWRAIPPPAPSGPTAPMAVDRRGRIVVPGAGGLVRYDGTWQRVPGSELPAERPVEALAACASGIVALLPDAYALLDEEGGWRSLDVARPGPLLEGAEALVDRVGPDEVALPLNGARLALLRGGVIAEVLALPEGVDSWYGAQRTSDGALWLTGPSGVFVHDGTSWTELSAPLQMGVRPLHERVLEHDGAVWLLPHRYGGLHPVLRWNGEELEAVSPPVTAWDAVAVPGLGIVTTDRSGEVRIVDETGCRSAGRLEAVDDQLQDLALGPEGRLLARSYSGRLWVCDLASERWQSWLPESPAGHATVHDLARDGAGGSWLATSAGVLHFDGERFDRSYTRAAGHALDVVTAVHVDRAGRLWVGSGATFQGALVLEPDGSWTHVRDPFGPGQVHAIREAPDGALWFLLLGPPAGGRYQPDAGLLRHADGGWERFLLEEHGSPRCYDAEIAPDGTVLVGTIDGVLRSRGGRFVPVPGLEGLEARELHLAEDGTLWVGQGLLRPGVVRWRDGARIPGAPELEHLAGAAIADDPLGEGERGGVWITSPTGLYRFGSAGLSEPASAAGVPARSFWPLLVDPDGTLWLGSLGAGLVRFRPNDASPPVVLGLTSGPGPGHGDVQLAWRVTDPWEATPARELATRWRRVGEPWQPLSRERTARLAGLEVGRHAFEVIAVDRDGNVSEVKRLVVDVPPPLWARRAFLLPVGLSLTVTALLGVTLLRSRRQRRTGELAERRRLEASERHFRGLVERARLVFASFDEDETLRYASPGFVRALGLERDPRDLAELLAPAGESGRAALEALREARRGAGRPTPCELRLEVPGGATLWLYAVQSPREALPGAAATGYDLAAVDVTERAEAELERRELEALRRQSQKLEAIGQLAAGVSHDFNNLLTSVIGNVELLQLELRRRLSAGDAAFQRLEEISLSTRQGARLTGQLLAFSRRQRLEPRPVELGRVVRRMQGILRRLIREDVRFELRVSPEPTWVLFDPGQLEQVVMNLAINGRDAMPTGGVLTLETGVLETGILEAGILEADGAEADLPPGRYVALRVSDTGEGMDSETAKRVFEPFFTTKEPGKGTGLGLATVHGIVEQSGGVVRVHTAPGRGSTFEVLVPATEAVAEEPPELAAPELRGGTEEVLVCEDDEAVRSLTKSSFERQGYAVRATGSPGEAVAWAAEARDLRLLVTDVLLPEMNGRELAERLRADHPGLAVLFVSGYASNLLDGAEVLEDRAAFLEKPFRLEELLATARELLDRPDRPDRSKSRGGEEPRDPSDPARASASGSG